MAVSLYVIVCLAICLEGIELLQTWHGHSFVVKCGNTRKSAYHRLWQACKVFRSWMLLWDYGWALKWRVWMMAPTCVVNSKCLETFALAGSTDINDKPAVARNQTLGFWFELTVLSPDTTRRPSVNHQQSYCTSGNINVSIAHLAASHLLCHQNPIWSSLENSDERTNAKWFYTLTSTENKDISVMRWKEIETTVATKWAISALLLIHDNWTNTKPQSPIYIYTCTYIHCIFWWTLTLMEFRWYILNDLGMWLRQSIPFVQYI